MYQTMWEKYRIVLKVYRTMWEMYCIILEVYHTVRETYHIIQTYSVWEACEKGTAGIVVHFRVCKMHIWPVNWKKNPDQWIFLNIAMICRWYLEKTCRNNHLQNNYLNIQQNNIMNIYRVLHVLHFICLCQYVNSKSLHSSCIALILRV